MRRTRPEPVLCGVGRKEPTARGVEEARFEATRDANPGSVRRVEEGGNGRLERVADADGPERTLQREHPCVVDNFADLFAKFKGKRIVVFLDYDGTLTPIVSNPDDAELSESTRGVLREVASMFPTAIVSGRGLQKVLDFVKIGHICYAGSHGMDIAGPVEGPWCREGIRHTPAEQFEDMMAEVASALEEKMLHIPGATVENNKFCVSAHYRNCGPQHQHKVFDAVAETLHGREGIKVTSGKKVLEIRPDLQWDKGRALLYLLSALSLDLDPDVVPVYIGDDTTDEDAFEVLRDHGSGGLGILVSSTPRKTAASFSLENTDKVREFLQKLVEWGSNG